MTCGSPVNFVCYLWSRANSREF